MAIKNASDETLKYAREVRDLASVSGTGAEQASRLLQVLDDYELSAQDATAATRAMTKAGLTPTIETLAKLSDEYNAINDPMQQNEFILENLGRGGLQWVNVLKQGSTALMEQSKAVNENLILTDQQIRETERYRLAIDNMKDTMLGWKVAAVTGYLDAAAKQKIFSASVRAGLLQVVQATRGGQEYAIAVAGLNAEIARNIQYGLAWEAALKGQGIVIIDAEEAARALTETNQSFIETLTGVASAADSYKDGLADAKQQLTEGKITTEEYGAKVNELAGTFQEAKNVIVLSLIEMKLGADKMFDDSDLNIYLAAAEKLGMITFDDAAATRALLAEATALAKGQVLLADKTQNLAGRQEDAIENADSLRTKFAEMGGAIRSDALPAMSGLVSKFNALPPTNTSFDYFFNMHVSGRVPHLPSQGGGGNPETGQVGGAVGEINYDDDFNPVWRGAAGGLGLSDLRVGQMASVGEVGEEGVMMTPAGLAVIPANKWRAMKSGGGRADRGYAFGDDPYSSGGSSGATLNLPGSFQPSGNVRTGNRSRGPAGGGGTGGGSAGGSSGSPLPMDIMPNNETAIASALNQGQQASVMVGNQQNQKLDKVIQVLQMIYNQSGSPVEIAKANSEQASKHS